jgi:hypothetical protein
MADRAYPNGCLAFAGRTLSPAYSAVGREDRPLRGVISCTREHHFIYKRCAAVIQPAALCGATKLNLAREKMRKAKWAVNHDPGSPRPIFMRRPVRSPAFLATARAQRTLLILCLMTSENLRPACLGSKTASFIVAMSMTGWPYPKDARETQVDCKDRGRA